MQNNKFRKELIIGTILILVGVSVVSGLGNNFLKYSNNLNPGNWLYVGGSEPGNYSTITEALFYAVNGDKIFVYDDSSPYYETVIINKEIYLIGEATQTTIVDGSNSSDVLRISANNVTIQGFTITNATNGISISGDFVIIKRNIICNNFGYGISLGGFGDSATISENTIKDNGHLEPNITGYGGIMLGLTASNKIINNNFFNNSKMNAFFFKAFLNIWLFNYWDRPRILPYPIFGLQAIIPPIFWVQFDLRPRLIPYIMP